MKHPAKLENEIFIGNTCDGVPEYLVNLKTIRAGIPAYDLDGNTVKKMNALFVDRSESQSYDNIMMARLSAIRRG